MDDLELQKVLAQRIFLTPDAAAIDALNRIAERDYEMGGVIYKDKGGRHMYTDPQGNKRTGQFEARVTLPRGSRPVGIYHTHPQGDHDSNAEVFSQNDVATADALKLLSYIKALGSGNIRKYHPGVTPTRAHRSVGSLASRGAVSDGDLMTDPLKMLQEINRVTQK